VCLVMEFAEGGSLYSGNVTHLLFIVLHWVVLEDPQVRLGWPSPWSVIFLFSALTLLVGWQKGHPACKKLGVGLLVVTFWLELFTSYSSSGYHHLHHP